MNIKKTDVAGLLVSSTVLAIALGKSKAAAASQTTPVLPTPAPSNLPRPPVPGAPPVQPQPPAPAAPGVQFVAGHRYEIVAHVKPSGGVGLITMAKRALEVLRFEDASLKSNRTVDRPGVGKVTEVRFVARSIGSNRLPLGQPVSIPGAGTAWLVSAKEVGG